MNSAGGVALPTRATGRAWVLRPPVLSFPQKLVVAFALAIGIPLFGYALAVSAVNEARLGLMDEAALGQRVTIAEQTIRAQGKLLYQVSSAAAAAVGGSQSVSTAAEWDQRLRDLAAAHGLASACVIYPDATQTPVPLRRDLTLDAAIAESAFVHAAAAGYPSWGVLALSGSLAVVAAAPVQATRGATAAVLAVAQRLAGADLSRLLAETACTASVRTLLSAELTGRGQATHAPRQQRGAAGFVRETLSTTNGPESLSTAVVLWNYTLGAAPVLLTMGMKPSALPGRGPRFMTVALCAFACALLLAALLTSVVSAWVAQPLDDLRTRVEAIAEGKTGTPPLEVATSDALGRVAVAFNEMVRNLDDAQRKALHNERLAIAGKMATAVAHEVRNVLSPIQLRAEILLQGVQDPVARESLEGTRDEVNRGTALLRSLLEFASKNATEFRPVALGELVERASDLVSPQFRKAGVRLSVEDESAGALVFGDRAQLLQLLVNLLNNAHEAEAKHVTLRSGFTKAQVQVIVTDDGVGMDSATLERALEPFFTTKPAGQGTGLGLSICQSVVKAHGGSLAIDSRKDGGTRVTLVLPTVGASQCASES